MLFVTYPVMPTVHENVPTKPLTASEYSFVNNEQANSRVKARREGCSLNERVFNEPAKPSFPYEPTFSFNYAFID